MLEFLVISLFKVVPVVVFIFVDWGQYAADGTLPPSTNFDGTEDLSRYFASSSLQKFSSDLYSHDVQYVVKSFAEPNLTEADINFRVDVLAHILHHGHHKVGPCVTEAQASEYNEYVDTFINTTLQDTQIRMRGELITATKEVRRSSLENLEARYAEVVTSEELWTEGLPAGSSIADVQDPSAYIRLASDVDSILGRYVQVHNVVSGGDLHSVNITGGNPLEEGTILALTALDVVCASVDDQSALPSDTLLRTDDSRAEPVVALGFGSRSPLQFKSLNDLTPAELLQRALEVGTNQAVARNLDVGSVYAAHIAENGNPPLSVRYNDPN